MVLQTLELDKNVKNGKEYLNLQLKPKWNAAAKAFKGGITPNNHIVVTKEYAEGKEIETKYGPSFICNVKYGDAVASFFLSPREHDAYKSVGGQGDRVRISLTQEQGVNPKNGMPFLRNVLHFELDQ